MNRPENNTSFAIQVARNTLLEKTIEELQCTLEEISVRDRALELRSLEVECERQRYQNLFDFAPDGYLVTDISGNIQEANQAILDQLSIKRDFLVGKPFIIYIAPDCQNYFYTQIALVTETKMSWELTLKSRNDVTFPVEVTVIRNFSFTTKEPQLCWFLRNISDRKKAEMALCQLNQDLEIKVAQRTAELELSKEIVRNAFDNTAVGMLVRSLEGKYLKANAALCHFLGYSETELLKMTYDETVYLEDREGSREPFRQILAGEIENFHLEKRYITKQGQIVWGLLSVSLVKDIQKKPLYYVAQIQDISDRKIAEAHLQKVNEELVRATHLKDEFLANMSHELRTPLNAILGMTEGLQDGIMGNVNERQIKALKTIEESGNHLLALINDILDLAKIESGEVTLDLATTSIGNLCQSSLSFIKQQVFQKQIQLNLKLPAFLPQIIVDERRIRQVLINLLSNAVKFTPKGGNITLEVAFGEKHLQIDVIDTGIGIAPENINKLFQPFIQIDSALNRQYEGTGLGLALVKRMVELHGGEVGITSELGKGSCFTVMLPWIQGNVLPEVTIKPDPPNVSTDCSILLVEDNETNIITTSNYLEAKGYRILIAKSGIEAIDLAQTHLPSLILMDIQMPGMDGLEATRQIRLHPNLINTPIIALTALAMPGDRDRCIAAGANEYITKPVKLKQLVSIIQTHLSHCPL